MENLQERRNALKAEFGTTYQDLLKGKSADGLLALNEETAAKFLVCPSQDLDDVIRYSTMHRDLAALRGLNILLAQLSTGKIVDPKEFTINEAMALENLGIIIKSYVKSPEKKPVLTKHLQSMPTKRKRDDSGYGCTLTMLDIAKSLSKLPSFNCDNNRKILSAKRTRGYMSNITREKVDICYYECGASALNPVPVHQIEFLEFRRLFYQGPFKSDICPAFIKPNIKGEKRLTKHFIKYLDESLHLENLEIVAADGSPYLLEIPFDDRSILCGKPDALVVPKHSAPDHYIFNADITFEFKVKEADVLSSLQPLVELLGAVIQTPKKKHMVITTNMKTFRFSIVASGKLTETTTTNHQDAISFIRQFIGLSLTESDEQLQTISITAKRKIDSIKTRESHAATYYFVDEYPFDQTQDYTTSYGGWASLAAKLERGLLQIIDRAMDKPTRGRSGQTYFIVIELNGRTHHLALKLHSCNLPDQILKEMENEVRVYHHLGDDWADESQINEMLASNTVEWRPRLVYGGMLFNENYFAICTTRIMGFNVAPGGKVSQIKKTACEEALRHLHENMVAHNDVRRPNFIIRDGGSKAAILDFGFSQSFVNETDFEEAKSNDLKSFGDSFN